MWYPSLKLFAFQSSILLLGLYSTHAAAAETADEGVNGWKIAMLLFAAGMVLSIFHSIKMLRGSSKPGPAYWAKRFEAACNKHDHGEAKQALLYWGKSMYGEKAPSTLEGLATHMESTAAREQIRLLQDVCHEEDLPAGDEAKHWNAFLCGQVVGNHLYALIKAPPKAE
ncbi:MAG: hypothetical protein MI754_09775 [Chromatiales bacterium]|nr:hypothetical protein [Chromatiales bacterium]